MVNINEVPIQVLMVGENTGGDLEAINATNGGLEVSMSNGINAETDSLKVETNGQGYYDLIGPDPITIGAGATVNVSDFGNGANYSISASGGWILHPDIKRAKAIMVYGNFTQSTEVKLLLAPIDSPDSNTPEFISRTDGETEWMFRNSANQAVASPAAPCTSLIVPISANAIKIYMKNTGGVSEDVSWFRMRLFF